MQCNSCKHFSAAIPESRTHPQVDDDECEFISKISNETTCEGGEDICRILESLMFVAAGRGECPHFEDRHPKRWQNR
jgi:hypothetical protein